MVSAKDRSKENYELTNEDRAALERASAKLKRKREKFKKDQESTERGKTI